MDTPFLTANTARDRDRSRSETRSEAPGPVPGGLLVWDGGGLVLMLFVLDPLFGSDARPAWLIVLLAFMMLNTVAALRRPQGLAAYRMLINGVLVIWLVSITSSAALRTALITAQRRQSEVAADVANAGITSGIIIAWVAGLIAFAGVVGLWAKRREEVEASERARRQLEAARESEAQLTNTATEWSGSAQVE